MSIKETLISWLNDAYAMERALSLFWKTTSKTLETFRTWWRSFRTTPKKPGATPT